MLGHRRALVDAGKTITEIAAIQGVSVSAVSAWANRHGIKVKRAPFGRAPVDWESLWREGLTANEAADRMDMTPQAAWKWAKVTGNRWAKAVRAGAPRGPRKSDLTPRQLEFYNILRKKVSYSAAHARAVVLRDIPSVSGPDTQHTGDCKC